jgi:hypothetical protein
MFKEFIKSQEYLGLIRRYPARFPALSWRHMYLYCGLVIWHFPSSWNPTFLSIFGFFGVRRTAEFLLSNISYMPRLKIVTFTDYDYLYQPGKNVRSTCTSPVVPRTHISEDLYPSIQLPVPAPHPSTCTDDPLYGVLPRTSTWAHTPRPFDLPWPLVYLVPRARHPASIYRPPLRLVTRFFSSIPLSLVFEAFFDPRPPLLDGYRYRIILRTSSRHRRKGYRIGLSPPISCIYFSDTDRPLKRLLPIRDGRERRVSARRRRRLLFLVPHVVHSSVADQPVSTLLIPTT